MLIKYKNKPAYKPANTSSSITPHALSNFVSAHFAGSGLIISKNLNKKNPKT